MLLGGSKTKESWMIEAGWENAAHPMDKTANWCIGECWFLWLLVAPPNLWKEQIFIVDHVYVMYKVTITWFSGNKSQDFFSPIFLPKSNRFIMSWKQPKSGIWHCNTLIDEVDRHLGSFAHVIEKFSFSAQWLCFMELYTFMVNSQLTTFRCALHRKHYR